MWQHCSGGLSRFVGSSLPQLSKRVDSKAKHGRAVRGAAYGNARAAALGGPRQCRDVYSRLAYLT